VLKLTVAARTADYESVAAQPLTWENPSITLVTRHLGLWVVLGLTRIFLVRRGTCLRGTLSMSGRLAGRTQPFACSRFPDLVRRQSTEPISQPTPGIAPIRSAHPEG
jgi:hypothetical protein